MGQTILILVIAIQLVIVVFSIIILLRNLHKPTKSKALVRTGMGGTQVIIEGATFVFPIMHQLEAIDLSIKTFNLRQTAYAKDGAMVIIDALFYLGINKDKESISLAATEIGAQRTFDQEALKAFFEPKLGEAIKKVAAAWDSATLVRQTADLKLEILKAIGTYLNGYVLDDCIVNQVTIPSTTQNY